MNILSMPRFTTLLFVALTSPVFSAVDLTSLIKDTQRVITNNQRVTIVWWIPEQFWEESFRQQAGLSAEQKAEFKEIMDPYTVFCVAVLDVGPMGGIKGKSKELLLANTKFKIGKKVISPLADDELSADAKNFYAMMKPVFANMMGQMGQGLEFIVYRKDKFVERSLDPLSEGAFQYEIYGETAHWRLPLGSLLPKKIDPATSEEFPGDYNYNPFSGGKLEVKATP